MILRLYNDPPGAAQAVSRTLYNLGYIKPERASNDPFARPADGRSDFEPNALAHSFQPAQQYGIMGLELSPPLLVRVLSEEGLHQQPWYQSVSVMGWRYILPDENHAADFSAADHLTVKIISSSTVKRLLEAANHAAKLFESDQQLFQVGILEIPTLRLEALTIEADLAKGARTPKFIVYENSGPVNMLQVEDSTQFSRVLADILEGEGPAGRAAADHFRSVTAIEFPLPTPVTHVAAAAGSPADAGPAFRLGSGVSRMSDHALPASPRLASAALAERISILFQRHLPDVEPGTAASALAFLAGASVANLSPEERARTVRALCDLLAHAADGVARFV